MNSSVTPRLVALLHSVRRIVCAVARRTPMRRSRRAPAASAPSACRGPSRSSGRRSSRCGRPGSSARSRTADVRRDVASVGERVDPRPVGHPLPLRELEQRPQVVDVRVDAAVRDEPEQVHVPAALACAAERRDERRRSRRSSRRAIGAVDALEVLVEHAAGADRQMADLGVAHLAGAAGRPPRPTRRAACAGTPPRAGRTPACRASSTAFPGPGGAQPQPSRMTSATSGNVRLPGKSRRRSRCRATRRRRARRRRRGCAISSSALSGLTEPP